jgi:hypothetical protein
MERQALRQKVWNAMDTYYWDRAKLLEWYRRLSSSTGDVFDIVKGMEQYPDLELIRIKGA